MHTLGTALLLYRPAILLVGALAQVYLFLQVRRALQASAWSERFRSRATWCVGAAIGFLWALHTYVVLARLPWVEPPFVAQVGLLSPAVVWNYGSILSALVLWDTARHTPPGCIGSRSSRCLSAARCGWPTSATSMPDCT
jgi:hypothetical protein